MVRKNPEIAEQESPSAVTIADLTVSHALKDMPETQADQSLETKHRLAEQGQVADIMAKLNPSPAIGKLADFGSEEDMAYFHSLEGQDGWIAMGSEFYKNSRYFTVLSETGEKLGIIGAYDTDDEKNVAHVVVDPKFRGKGLAAKFYDLIMEKLKLPFLTLTIDLNNTSSIRAAEKLPGINKVSDAQYEKEFHKVKYVYERK